jgi:hypothetical protein
MIFKRMTIGNYEQFKFLHTYNMLSMGEFKDERKKRPH